MPTMKAARQFLLLRLDAEADMRRLAHADILHAIRRIVAAAQKYHIPPARFRFDANPRLKAQVDAIIQQLLENLTDHTETLAAKEADDKTPILLYIRAPRGGNTFHARLRTYTQGLRHQIQETLRAELLNGATYPAAERNLIAHIKHPWNSPAVKKATKSTTNNTNNTNHPNKTNPTNKPNNPEKEEKEEENTTKNPSPSVEAPTGGPGRTNSMHTAILNLTALTVAIGYMHHWKLTAGLGAHYFISHRGSSYPCDHCDHMAERPLPISQYIGPWHPHCKCYFTFI